ncbi:uncharacterized protein TNCV_1396951 [Trichonephila clavipes]|nr:uncharacterized protein TNCV_1396951 [Trichonephila clavipes]
MQAFEWHRRLRESRESVEDDKYSGFPQTFRTAENTKNVSVAVRKNMLQTIVGISSATCERISTKDLSMHKVCRHIVLYMLNEDQYADEVKSAS